MPKLCDRDMHGNSEMAAVVFIQDAKLVLRENTSGQRSTTVALDLSLVGEAYTLVVSCLGFSFCVVALAASFV